MSTWDEIDASADLLADALTDEFERDGEPGTAAVRQYLNLAEECGEAVGAFRRWRGMARRSDTEDHAREELADVVITALVTAHTLGWDLRAACLEKLDEIWKRGLRDQSVDLGVTTVRPAGVSCDVYRDPASGAGWSSIGYTDEGTTLTPG